MSSQETVTSGAIVMSWDPEARLAHMHFQTETEATGQDAQVLIRTLERWIGTDGRPFGLLGDGDNLGAVDAEYRARWAEFLRERRQQAFLAFFNMNAIIRIAAEMFGLGTRLPFKAFARESEARAWLRDQGIHA